MSKWKHAKKTQISAGNVIYWTVGTLLVLAMLTTWLAIGILAKYLVADKRYDSAGVAGAGIGRMELWEHQAKLENGEYKLKDDEDDPTNHKEVTENKYEKVIPGVDIPKDPFVRIELTDPEVSYVLYIRVTKSNPFPDTVTYELTDDWVLVDAANGIYKYKKVFSAGEHFEGEISILKDNKLYVSEHYEGKGQEFSLSFIAYLMQEKSY